VYAFFVSGKAKTIEAFAGAQFPYCSWN